MVGQVGWRGYRAACRSSLFGDEPGDRRDMQAETGGAQRRRVLVVGLAAACVVLALGAPRASAAPTCAPSGADIVCSFATPGTDAWTVPSGVTQVKAVAYGA